MTTTPIICTRRLRPGSEEQHGRGYRASEDAFNWVLARYEGSLRWVFRHQRATLLVTLATMVATAYLYVRVPKGFFPQQDTGRLSGSIQADQGTSFQAMQSRVSQLLDIVMQDPAVDTVQAYMGGGGFGGAQNTARMNVALKPLDEHRVGADAVIARLRGKLAGVPG